MKECVKRKADWIIIYSALKDLNSVFDPDFARKMAFNLHSIEEVIKASVNKNVEKKFLELKDERAEVMKIKDEAKKQDVLNKMNRRYMRAMNAKRTDLEQKLKVNIVPIEQIPEAIVDIKVIRAIYRMNE